jgi:hypothetical protein
MATTKAQLKKKHVARTGGTVQVEDTEDKMDGDAANQDYAEAELDLDVDSYVEVDKYEIEMLKKDSNFNEGTASTDGDGEEDADGAAFDVSIPVDPAVQQETHKRNFYNLTILQQTTRPT